MGQRVQGRGGVPVGKEQCHCFCPQERCPASDPVGGLPGPPALPGQVGWEDSMAPQPMSPPSLSAEQNRIASLRRQPAVVPPGPRRLASLSTPAKPLRPHPKVPSSSSLGYRRGTGGKHSSSKGTSSGTPGDLLCQLHPAQPPAFLVDSVSQQSLKRAKGQRADVFGAARLSEALSVMTWGLPGSFMLNLLLFVSQERSMTGRPFPHLQKETYSRWFKPCL